MNKIKAMAAVLKFINGRNDSKEYLQGVYDYITDPVDMPARKSRTRRPRVPFPPSYQKQAPPLGMPAFVKVRVKVHQGIERPRKRHSTTITMSSIIYFQIWICTQL